ncbi:unnamed protein product [Closterium sp. Naga37s-1]|nr:unnamed protein product [Closterium sp. Naga37s-1]
MARSTTALYTRDACLLHHASYIMPPAPCLLHHASCTMPPAPCLLHHASCTIPPAPFLLHHSSCTIPPAPFILHHSSCSMPPTPFLLHHSSCTIPPAPCLLHHSSCTMPPAPFLLHHASCTIPPAPCLLHHSSCTMPPAPCQQPRSLLLLSHSGSLVSLSMRAAPSISPPRFHVTRNGRDFVFNLTYVAHMGLMHEVLPAWMFNTSLLGAAVLSRPDTPFQLVAYSSFLHDLISMNSPHDYRSSHLLPSMCQHVQDARRVTFFGPWAVGEDRKPCFMLFKSDNVRGMAFEKEASRWVALQKEYSRWVALQEEDSWWVVL